MKFKKIVLLTGCTLALFGGLAHANIVISLPSGKSADVCDALVGGWSGSGQITALGGLLVCNYSGTGSFASAGSAGNYKVHVDLATSSGWPCANVSKDLNAACGSGNLVVTSDDQSVNLTGTTDGKTVTISKGTVAIDGVTANVKYIDLSKTS